MKIEFDDVPKIKTIKWTVEVIPQEMQYTVESVVSTRSEEYNSFVDGVIIMLELKGYLYNREYTHKSPDSESMYYEFVKFDDDLQIKLLVEFRISEHPLPDIVDKDGKKITGHRRLQNKAEKRATQVMKDFHNEEIPVSVPVNIIFDNQHFLSYEEALLYINRRINRLD